MSRFGLVLAVIASWPPLPYLGLFEKSSGQHALFGAWLDCFELCRGYPRPLIIWLVAGVVQKVVP